VSHDLAPGNAALQQRRAPRPLPLFLELVRETAERDPELARAALAGLSAYQQAPRHAAQHERSIVAQLSGASLRDCGGTGAPIVLVPSLINPPGILDLDPECSLAGALNGSGHVLLLDWGAAEQRSQLSVSAHVTELLVPLLAELGERAVLVGYCLGGTMALAAAAVHPHVRAVATLAAPWRFSAYPDSPRAALARLWSDARTPSEQLGVLPIEVLQAAFWSLDPERVVAKFARFANADPNSPESRRFVALEDWANAGEPLPLPAARELIEDLFGADLPGSDRWLGRGLPSCPTLHVTACGDRITPAASSPTEGEHLSCNAGHVGMIVGRSTPQALHQPMREWLARL
jgi:polyhydroxyalkanoate synthase